MRIKTLALLFLILPWNINAQGLSKLLYHFRNHPALKNAVVGYHIIDLKTGKALAGHNAAVLMIPASTLKTLYVFSALNDYGKDYFYQTDLLYHGQIKHDTLYGDLILRSGGDPTFGSALMGENTKEIIDQTIEKIKALGIRTVMGNIYLQVNGDFYPAPGSWPLEDIGNYYGAGYWGFNYSDNTFKIYLKNYAVTGKPAVVDHTEPEIYNLKLHSKVRTDLPGSGDNAYVYADPLCYERYIFGTIPAGDSLFVIKGAIPNPPQFFIDKLKDYFRREGIDVVGVGRIETQIKHYQDEKIIWSKISKPLIDIAKQTLNYSVNLYSEGLARLVIEKGAPADGYMNKDSINAYFRSKGFRLIDLEDGSGLAPDNLIAPREFTRFFYRLSKVHGTAYLRDILPHAGEDGYAKHFMDGLHYQSRVWVKSGSVSKVQNYVGIFRGRSGRYYAFALMVNHFSAPRKDVQKQMQLLLNRMISVL